MRETNVPIPVPSPSTVTKIAAQGTHPIKLVEATDYQEPLIVSVYGTPGTGKSRLCGSAKGDIGLIPTERKAKQVIAEAQKFGRRVIIPSIDLIRTENPMLLSVLPNSCIVIGDNNHKGWTPGQIQDEMQTIGDRITLEGAPLLCCKRHYYRWHVNRVKWACFQMALYSPNISTIVIDTFGQLVDDISYANYGLTGVIDPKEFGFAPREDMNKEVRDFLNTICHKNLILTHHASDVWKDGKPTKQTKAASAFGKIGHYTSVMLEMKRNWQADPNLGQPTFTMLVKECQANASLIGLDDLLTDDGITFSNLAQLVYPDSDAGEWE